ncbi:MAG TPA: T9SS type A sorting domain-containing protein [Candidatus Kapabacteria bacterium]|nr:T9SS type A sorting domain-containing protein [Candidatus Kapabacteria bacterium]
MKLHSFFGVMALSLLVITGDSFGQPTTFEQTAGPAGAQVWTFAKGSGNVVLAAASKQVFRTTNKGASWTSSSQSFDFSSQSAIAFDPAGTVAYAVTSSGAYKSTDQGVTWNQVASLTAPSLLSITVNSNGTIIVGTYGAGVFSSSNQGTSWSNSTNGIPVEPGVTDLFPVTRLFRGPSGSVFGITAGGLIRSTDEGSSWTNVSTGSLPQVVAAIAVSAAGTLYATSQAGIFSSADSGNSWNIISGTGGLNITSGTEVATDEGNSILVSGGAGLWFSRNGGASWKSVRAATADVDNALCLLGKNSDFFEGLSKNGVFASHDTCKTWNPSSKGMITASVQAMGADSSGNIFAVADTAELYRSVDQGDTWLPVQSDVLVSHNFTSITATSATELYATAFGTAVYHSTDDGNTWTDITAGSLLIGINKTLMRASCVTPSGTVFLGGFNGTVYRSIDNGLSWSIKRSGIPQDTIKFLTVGSQGYVFAFCTSGVYYTTNNGDAWQLSSNLVTNPLAVTAHSTTGYVYASNADGVYYTNNNGASWLTLSSSLKNITGLVIESPSLFMIAASATAMSTSSSGGSVWFAATFPFASTPTFMYDDAAHQIAYAGTTGSGLYRTQRPSKSGVTMPVPVAWDASVVQNYPNPFAGETTIRYVVPLSSLVRLDMLDITGKEIATLVNEFQTNGEHEISFDAASLHLADGVYMCRLQSEGMTVTKGIVHHSF